MEGFATARASWPNLWSRLLRAYATDEESQASIARRFEVSERIDSNWRPTSTPSSNAGPRSKPALRAAAVRTLNPLGEVLPAILDTVNPKDAHGWFRHCG